MKTSIALSLGAAAFFFAPLALANNQTGGGYNGKPNISFPNGDTCNRCHSGGTAPSVSLTGPATLTAGQSAEYTFTVQSGTRRAVEISATDTEQGTDPSRLVVVTPGQNTEQVFDEVTHTLAGYNPANNANGVFKFNVKASATNGTIRLYAAGLASNNSNSTSGDKATLVTKDISVTGGIDPDAGPVIPDGGTSGTDAGTVEADGGGTGTGSSGGVGDDAGTGMGGNNGGVDGDGLPQNDSGCSLVAGDASSGLAWLGALGAFAALGGARRRRR